MFSLRPRGDVPPVTVPREYELEYYQFNYGER